MKKIYYILLISIIFSLVLYVNFYLSILSFKSPEGKITLNKKEYKCPNNFSVLDKLGYINIHNVTVNKLIAEIGENISVSTVYTLLINESYILRKGNIGIWKVDWFEYKGSIIHGVAYHNVTETIPIDPNHFDAFDICKGKVEIEIQDPLNSNNIARDSKTTIENLELRKANLNYSIIDQNPITIFSQDIVNFSLVIYNEHTEKYVCPNNYVEFNITNKNNSLIFSKYTNSKGIVNISVNCPLLGPGNYAIQLKINGTADYESTTHIHQLEVLDESTCINFSLLNEEDVYTSVIYDNSNYSKAFYQIQCEFNANISWYCNFSSGIFSKTKNYYNATILSPTTAGIYQMHFIAEPISKGKSIEFYRDLEVKKRPIHLSVQPTRSENQSLLNFQIKVLDKLKSHLINKECVINVLVKYNNSNWNLEPIQSNSTGIANLEWAIPCSIIEKYIVFEFMLNETPEYRFSSLIENLTITNLEYSGPFHVYQKQNITIKVILSTLNGDELSNQTIQLKIYGKPHNLITDLNGEIFYSLIAPSNSTILEIEVEFMGSENILSSLMKLKIEIKFDFIYPLWNSSGFILMGVSIIMVTVLYLKKILKKRNLGTLDVK